MIQKLVAAYKLWHEIVPNFPKTSRYTLGGKVDSLFLETVEFLLSAGSVSSAERLIKVSRALSATDSVKFLLQVAWEIRSLDTKKYTALSEKLDEIGRMLGGWLKQLSQKTSPK